MGHEHARIPVPRAAWPTRSRHDQASRGHQRRWRLRQAHHLRRWPEHPHRDLSVQGWRSRLEHPEHLVFARHRRRRQGGQAGETLRSAWLRARHARHAVVVHSRARRLAASHARFQQHDHRQRRRRLEHHDELRQHVSRAVGRLKRAAVHLRASQPVRHVPRFVRKLLHRRLPQLADLSAHSRCLLPELRQAARRHGLCAHGDPAHAQLKRPVRHRFQRGQSLAGGVPRQYLRRQRRHQPRQSRQDPVARQ